MAGIPLSWLLPHVLEGDGVAHTEEPKGVLRLLDEDGGVGRRRTRWPIARAASDALTGDDAGVPAEDVGGEPSLLRVRKRGEGGERHSAVA